MHNHFIELRGQLVLGRSAEISTIMEFVQNGTQSDGSSTEGHPPLIVLGSSGSGKSTLMAHCTLGIKKVCKVMKWEITLRVFSVFHKIRLAFL